jgi:HTH-type transcriptional regulator/antitoxin HigA
MTGPDPEEILRAWKPLKKALGVTSVRTEREYARARATMDALLDEIGDDERHPLAEVLDYLADRIRAYEEEHVQISDADPGEVLRFLMEQHGLKQDDLADCAPQSRISDFLSGKREIRKDVAKKLAARFNVRADLFF